VSVNNWTSS